jgi:tRNA pseudouridine13 synthase
MAKAADVPGIEILGISRHENKLKPGHLLGNRFRIALRGLDAEGLAEVRARLEAIKTTGVPNAFGPQRFGRDGENPERALSFVRGETRGPRDRREQRLLFSALQSLWFNRVLEAREADGSWSRVLPGDLAKKHDTGGLFLVPAEGPELADALADAFADAKERAMAGGISPTGPMFGAKMRWPEGAPREIEQRVLDQSLGNPERLEGLRHLGEGTRRALRIMVSELTVEALEETQSGHSLAVCFVLPKGGYATTVLARACELIETRGSAREDSQGADAAGPGDEDAANDDGR